MGQSTGYYQNHFVGYKKLQLNLAALILGCVANLSLIYGNSRQEAKISICEMYNNLFS